MHAHVEGDRSCLSDVAPRADDDRIVAPDVCLDHQVEFFEKPLFDHGSGESVRRISAIVLGGCQHNIGSFCRVDDRPARPHGDPERLLADDVQPFLERGSSDEMMDSRAGDDVERLHGSADDQLLVVREHRRARSQECLRHSGRSLCRSRARVADGCELEPSGPHTVECRVGVKVPDAHPSAADQADGNAVAAQLERASTSTSRPRPRR